MTEEELREKYKDVSTGELIKRIFVLLGKLIVAILVFAFRKVVKGIAWCLKKCVDGWEALVTFWNSSDTQEKKRKVIAATKRGAKTFGRWCIAAWEWLKKYTIIGAKAAWKYTVKGCKLFVKYSIITAIAIWEGFLWTLKTLKDLVIHSKPTFIKIGKAIHQGAIDFWHWQKRARRGMRLSHLRRKRAWLHFRRTKGFKGLLADMGKGMANGISSFMEEEQTDAAPEAITEDDIIAEEIEERQGPQQSTANKLGQKFFKGMKDIVEEK